MPLKRRGFVDRDAILRGVLGVIWRARRGFSRFAFETRPAEDPRTVGERMDGVDLTVLCGPPECLGGDVKKPGGLGQVEPGLNAVGRRAMDRDPVVGSQRGHPLPCPAIAVAGDQTVTVQKPRDQIVAGDADQQADGFDDIGRGAVARPAPFGMDAARPMNGQHDLAGVLVNVGNHFPDYGSDDALLEPGIRRRGRQLRAWRRARIVFGDLRLERGGPARLQLDRHQVVGWIGGIVVADGAVRRTARRLEIADQHLASMIASLGLSRPGLHGRRDHPRLHHLEQHLLDRLVDPQSAERDAAGLAVVEPSPGTAVARDVVLLSSTANRQLPAAAAAAQETRTQGIAVLRRAVMTACRDSVADPLAYRLRAFPLDRALLRAGLQREPRGARLAPYPRPRPCPIIARLHARLAIGVAAAIGRVDDHPMQGGVARPAPHDGAVARPRRQRQIVLVDPQQRLARAAQLLDRVEDQSDRLLHPPVRVLLQPVARLDEANRGADHERAAPSRSGPTASAGAAGRVRPR